MKLKYEFTIMDMGNGDISAVPVGEGAEKFHGMLQLNKDSLEIFELLKEHTTPYKLHDYLKAKNSDATDQEIADALNPFLLNLLKEGLLIMP